MMLKTKEIDVTPGYDEPMKYKPTGDVGVVCRVEYENGEWVKSVTMRVASSGVEITGPETDFEELVGEERQRYWNNILRSS
jgi:hypothetical protein